jgi:spermidine/putrescine transport system substrate-binding protein
MKRTIRSLLTVVAMLSLVIGGAGLSQSSTAAQGGGSLTVLDWAGFDDEQFWIDFKNAHPDVDVTFEMGASDADILAKMMAGSQADVFHPYTGWLQFYVQEGLVEELDTSRLTNWDAVPERFKELGQFDGKQ